jgi:hypothetical protein
MMRSEFNTPASAWGFNTPLDLSDEMPYENVPHFCEWNCNTEVKHDGDVCDACLVDNAEACGDWDEESIKAAERMGVTPQTPQRP